MGYDVVLFQPRAGSWEKLGIRIPDSLLSIVGSLSKKGYSIKIIDTRIDFNWKKTFLSILKQESLLAVGITSMTGVQIRYALEISKFVKDNSQIPIIWGGVHASLLPKQTIENKNIDVVILGEGDYSFTEVVENLQKKDSLNKVKGIFFKEKNKIIKTEQRELIKNLDLLPDLPYELIDFKDYYSMNLGTGRSISLSTSRGCPFNCTFCYNKAFYGNSWRAMSADKVVKLIKYFVEKHGIRNFYFHDDNFSVDLKRVENIAKGIIKEKLNITYGLLGTRIGTLKKMSDKLLALLVKSGCLNIDIGIESGSARILSLIKKNLTISDVLLVNKKLAKHNIISKYTFIIGFPTETKKELSQSVKLAKKLMSENKNCYTPFFILTAYPGTEMFDLAIKHGYKAPNKLEDWSECNFKDVYKLYPWLSKKTIRKLINIQFFSNLASRNIKYKINNKLLRLLFELYHPIAKFRFHNNFYFLPLDRIIVNKLIK